MRVIILADIHANYQALAAVLESAPVVDAIFCLGDLVQFGPNPVECIDLIRTRADKVVSGNHDEETVRFRRQLVTQQSGDTDTLRWMQWTANQLRDDQVDYLAGLPEEIEVSMDSHRVILRHDLPLPGPLIMPDADEALIKSRMDKRFYDYLFVGHVHIPFIRTIGLRHLVDVGSVGQPEHGDGCASYAIWIDGKITFHKVTYDVERTIADLKALPLSASYIELWSKFWRHGYVDRHTLAMLEHKNVAPDWIIP